MMTEAHYVVSIIHSDNELRGHAASRRWWKLLGATDPSSPPGSFHAIMQRVATELTADEAAAVMLLCDSVDPDKVWVMRLTEVGSFDWEVQDAIDERRINEALERTAEVVGVRR